MKHNFSEIKVFDAALRKRIQLTYYVCFCVESLT